MPKLKSRLLTRRTLLAHFEHTDPKLAQLIEIAGPYRLRANECASPFRHLAEAIVSQQISGAAARSILRRFVSACGLDPLDDTMFPTPAIVLSLDAPILRAAGLSAAKVIALQDLARKTIDGIVPDTRTLLQLDDEAIVERLVTVRGIGRWTVQMMLMFQLGRPDVLPVDDYGVRNGFKLLFKKRELPTPGELARHGARWAPYRSAAAWYLWRAVDLAKAGELTSALADVRAVRSPPPDARTPTRHRPRLRSRAPASKK
jgi:DNA-3-methyladenine glycosylase II